MEGEMSERKKMRHKSEPQPESCHFWEQYFQKHTVEEAKKEHVVINQSEDMLVKKLWRHLKEQW